MNLNQKVALIRTREDFVAFVQELLRDLNAIPDEWENSTLESYLEAMAAWTEDAEGYYTNQRVPLPQHPSWRMLGEILLASKYYE